ncbi:DUF3558 family protein [Amycolatopsis sp. CA-230715]|uniref:DUF3558 family protein n=1 Tax=Amycolatopsis sp. CA-230715 TaxID=2745196 RepID=UPI0020B2B519|nr:DUF3558 family protein [Amycolatopsis sp. CA-230715]
MKKVLFVPLLAAALAGCSSAVPGMPSAAPPSAGAAGSSTAATAPPGNADTGSIDPCSLLVAADLAAYGTFEPPVVQDRGGARGCDFTKTGGDGGGQRHARRRCS